MYRKNPSSIFKAVFTLGKSSSLLILCLFFVNNTFAQDVWTLDIEDLNSNATLDIDVLQSLSIGDDFTIQVDEISEYFIQIDGIELMPNGDRSWYGSISNTGLDYALVITVGKQTAHLILTSPSGIFQLFGLKGEGNFFTGSFNRLQHVRDGVATTDTIVPVEAGNAQNGASTTSVNSSGDYLIAQKVSELTAAVGSTLTFQFDISNISTEQKFDAYADIYFVLENTSLNSLPAGCEILDYTDPSLPNSLLPLLRCALGDFLVKQQKKLSFSVSTSEQSHPFVYSTMVVEESRSDVVVELYRDVITDSDGDGISDFSEQLLGRDQNNGLEIDSDEVTLIDVLVAYTAEIDALYLDETETRINQLFNVANKIFADSNTGIQLRPVGIHEVSYIPAEDLVTDLASLTSQSDKALMHLPGMRNLYGGDLVVLFRTGEENGLCGLANLGGKGTNGDLSAGFQKDFAFSVINIDCLDDSVLAHEVGHNLGLVHSRREDPDGGTFPYSSGYGVENKFVTVMAFPDDFNVEKRLYRFSDSERDCGSESVKCGEEKDSVEGADAVASLKTVKYQIANYYKGQEERIKTIKSVSNRGGLINATLGIAAFTDGSSDFRSDFAASEKINFRVKVAPLPRHIGREFEAHIVIAHGEKLYQLDSGGELVLLKGGLKGLNAVTERRALGRRELFDIAKNVDFAEAEISGSVNIFVAYRLTQSNEFIYGSTPITIRLNTTNAGLPEFTNSIPESVNN